VRKDFYDTITELEGHPLLAAERRSRFRPIDREMADSFPKYKIDGDFQDLICSKPKYLHISKNEWGQIRSTGSVFDSQGRLRTEWLQKLLNRYRIEEDNTDTDDEKTLAPKCSPILEEDPGHIFKAGFFPSDCSINRPGKPHRTEQESQDVTRKLADLAPSFNKLQVLNNQITAEAPVSMHSPTPAIPGVGKNRSQDYSRSNDANDGDDHSSGDGSSDQAKNKEPVLSSIAEEILDLFQSRTCLSEYEIAVF